MSLGKKVVVMVETEGGKTPEFWGDHRCMRAVYGHAEIAQPRGPAQSQRGGGGRQENWVELKARIFFMRFGALTSQCPIVPAWRIDRMKSELIYISTVSTSLSDVSYVGCT